MQEMHTVNLPAQNQNQGRFQDAAGGTAAPKFLRLGFDDKGIY